MARKHRTSRTARGRVGQPGAASVTCPTCQKRLGLVFPSEGGRVVAYGADFVPHTGVTWERALQDNGVRNIAQEDWHSITCGRCGHNWQVREAKLRALALANAGGAVSLNAAVQIDEAPSIVRRSW